MNTIVLYVAVALLCLSPALSWSIKSKKIFGNALARGILITSLGVGAIADNAIAVSGGGKDYASKDIKGEDFSGQKLIAKDFSQCIAMGTNFKGAKLNGARFYKANLKDADFTGADLSTASLEDTSLEDTILTNAVLQGAYFSDSLQEVKSLKGADLTDALMPDFTKKKICARDDLSDTNPTTGVTTIESLFCP